jgi:hypothetical protein
MRTEEDKEKAVCDAFLSLHYPDLGSGRVRVMRVSYLSSRSMPKDKCGADFE